MTAEQKSGWKFSQYFGVKIKVPEILDADLLSAIEFNDSGEYLATGDHGGRIVVFQRTEHTKDDTGKSSPEYHFFTEFQSHEPEFDYLSSTEIQEKINVIRWIRSSSNALFLLSTNDKTIKLWKIYDRKQRAITYQNPEDVNSLQIPQVVTMGSTITSQNKNIYSHAHTFNINSLSTFSDGETFLSADDLRVNLWNIEQARQSFNIVDIKPSNMENLSEVITALSCHPSYCSIFIYSTSKGDTSMCDLRVNSRCTPVKIYSMPQEDQNGGFFSEIISSISSNAWSPDGQSFVTRDYMSVKLWDIRNNTQPVSILPVHSSLENRLEYLYENELLFDRFGLCRSSDGHKVCTGSYQSYFQIMDINTGITQTYEASRKSKFNTLTNQNMLKGISSTPVEYDITNQDFLRTITQVAWHPKEDIIALSGLNNLYIFTGSNQTI
ncbi:hypothetical protein WA158_006458 [Blastocystis sp. Blastoise]